MGLCLHKGAKLVDRKAIDMVRTPDGTDTWRPIGHGDFISLVEGGISDLGYEIKSADFALSKGTKGIKESALMFATLDLDHSDQFAVSLGLRNSHNKMFPAGICAGSRVFVCDNLAFSADMSASRRHTKNMHRDIGQVVTEMLKGLPDLIEKQDGRIKRYREADLSDERFDSFAIALVDQDVLPPSNLKAYLNEYRNSEHFEPGTVWSAFNAMTEVAKGDNVFTALPERTIRLHNVADQFS